MSRSKLGLVATSAILALGLFGAGCGKEKKSQRRRPEPTPEKQPEKQPETSGKQPEKQPETPPPAAGGTGSIAGSIAFTGTAPEMPEIDRKADPFCAKTPMKAETVMVNGNKTLKDVLVRIKPGTVKGTMPTTEIHVEQHDCMYRPRVQGAVADQKIIIKNGDDTTHNVHAFDLREGEGEESLYNLAQPKGAADIQKDANGYSVIKFKCDVHPWMLGYVVVNDHPFFAVTDDQGNFKIENVPAGDYEVEAWHPHYGLKSAKVTVAKDAAADPKLGYDGTEKAL